MQANATFTGGARRAQIVQATIETIAELGFARASYVQIAKRARLSSTGLISYHFADKDELLTLVVRAVTDEAAEVMIPRIEAAPVGRARLRAYIESNLEFMARRRSSIVALVEIFNAAPRGADGQPGRYAAHYRQVIARLEELLAEGQRAGELRAFSTHVMAVSIRSAIDAAGYELAADPELDVVAVGRELAELFDRATRGADQAPGTDRH